MTSRLALFFANPRRTAQTLVWATLIATLVPLFSILFNSEADFYASQAPSVQTPYVAQSADYLAATVLSSDEANLAAKASNVPPVAKDRVPNPNGDYEQWLPVFRWTEHLNLPDKFGFLEISSKISHSIAGLVFSISALIWGLVLQLVRFSMTSNIVNVIGTTIDAAFVQMWVLFNSSGLVAIAAIAAVVVAVLAIIKGRLGEAVKSILGGVLVLGILQFMATGALGGGPADGSKHEITINAKEVTGDKVVTSRDLVVGRPSWIAMTVSEQVNKLSTNLGSFFGVADGVAANTKAPGEDGGISCTWYNQRLASTYQDRSPGDNSDGESVLLMTSYVWQRTLLDNFGMAVFGSGESSNYLLCHYLEGQTNVRADYRQAIALGNGSPYSGMALGPFINPPQDTWHYQSELFSFAVCKSRNEARSGWGHIHHYANDPKNAAERCDGWWKDTTGGGMSMNPSSEGGGIMDWNGFGRLYRDTLGERGYSKLTDAANADAIHKDLQLVYGTVSSFWGYGGALIYSFASLALAVLFGFAFGGAALGALLAQLVLVVMLLLLPWTLIILAFPTKSGDRSSMGMKLLRLTLMSFGAKVVFMVVLGLTILIMALLYQIGDALTSGSSYFVRMLWGLIVPIATIYLTRKIMKMMGMGQMTGLTGGLKFATAAMHQGSDGAWLSSKTTQAQRSSTGAGTSKIGSAIRGAASKGKDAVADKARNSVAARKTNSLLERKNADGTPFLSADLRSKLLGGQLPPWRAEREQNLRRDLSPDLAARVASGELSLAAALRMQRAERSHLSDTIARNMGSTDRASLGGQFAHSPLSPLNLHPGSDSHADISARLAARNHALRTATANADPEAQRLAGVEALGSDMTALMAATRVDGSTDPLTLGEQIAANEQARSQYPQDLQDRVLTGSHGAPHVLYTALNEQGELNVTEELLDNPEALRKTLSNPVNLLPPQVALRDAEETVDEYTARINAALIETGLMDPSTGKTVDVVAELGLDGSDKIDELRSLAQQWQKNGLSSSASPVRDFAVSMDASSVARVQETVKELISTLPSGTPEDMYQEVTVNFAEHARDVQADTAAISEGLTSALQALSTAQGNTREMSRAQAELSKQMEQGVASALENMVSTKLDAQVLEFKLENPPTATVPFKKFQKKAEEELRALQESVAPIIAEAKLRQSSGDPADQARAVAALQNALSDLTKEHENMVSSIEVKAQEGRVSRGREQYEHVMSWSNVR